jgi:hypothetical protein
VRVQRHASGSVRYDKRRKTWNYLWYESGTRRSKLIGNKQQYPTKAAAWTAVESIPKQPHNVTPALTVTMLVEQYRQEKMPKRASTRRGYEVYLRNTSSRNGSMQTSRRCNRVWWSCGFIRWSWPRKARFTSGGCCTRYGITQCGAETCQPNVILWSWLRSRTRLSGYRNHEP